MASANPRRDSSRFLRFFWEEMRFSCANAVLDMVRVGDMVEFKRGPYSHYALYIGNDLVMNICAEEGETHTKAFICKLPFRQVCGGSPVKISNHEDIALNHFQARPKPRDEILRSAVGDEGRHVPFQIWLRNSEFYASKWRYGRGFSTQAAELLKTQAESLAQAMNGSHHHVASHNFDPYSEYKNITE